MRSPEWIIAQYRERRDQRGPILNRAADIAATYDGIVSVPLPELDASENAMVANLLRQGLDQLSNRVTSVQPQVMCPPVTRGNRKAEENAHIRRLAYGWWWQENRYVRKLRKRARWYIGYSASPVIIRPDAKRGIPVWEIRDPLASFPAPMPEGDDLSPTDCIFAVKRAWGWIYDRWPEQAMALQSVSTPDPTRMYEILEYLDADEQVMVAIGQPEQVSAGWGQRPQMSGAEHVELSRSPILVGRCPVVNPTRISLNDPSGQFDQMPGLYRAQARAMALWLIGNERAIFPDTWFVSRPNETVRVLERPDGRAGIPGQVAGGDLREVNPVPPIQVAQVIDTLERNQRVTASISSDFGGEAPTNVRTGRAGENLNRETVDFWLQEAQQSLSESGEEELKLATATARAYFGRSPKQSQHVNWKWAKGPVAYIPDVHFDSDVCTVSWPYAGSDANQLTVRIGQKIGLKEMSIRTAQELDPDIDDPELEHARIVEESLEGALLASLDQAAAAGQLGPLEIGRLTSLVMVDKMSLADAVQKLHEETQAQQAQQPGPAMGPGAGPDGGQPPPGLMAPGLQQQIGVGPMNPPGGGVPTPSPSVAHMAQLLSALRPRNNG